MLLRLALESPNREVEILVQKTGDSGAAEALVRKLGGEVTSDLSLINAFAARLTAQSVLDLAAIPSVKWISPDAVLEDSVCEACVDTANLASAFIGTIGADRLWNEEPYLQGQGITVAVVDSGIARHPDLDKDGDHWRPDRVIARSAGPGDHLGHGTHVAGIIAGNGWQSDGAYIGVAPEANLADVRVSRFRGGAKTSEVIGGLQWVFDHKDEFNIRVVNLSLNSDLPESYHTSPLDAALEILWFNGIVVVVSAGNLGGDSGLYPPANDPFVITAGAFDDQGTVDLADDHLTSYSAPGITQEGFTKPDIFAPGDNIVSLMTKPSSLLGRLHPDHKVGRYYFRMSGTSMASAVVAGAAALLLQDEPGLNPDQVKFRLMATARPLGDSPGAGALDIYAAVHSDTTMTANTGVVASQLLWTGADPVNWGSVNWGSVNWGSVNWGSVNWGSVNWGSVNWGADYWEP
jgi:serine protease AprX